MMVEEIVLTQTGETRDHKMNKKLADQLRAIRVRKLDTLQLIVQM